MGMLGDIGGDEAEVDLAALDAAQVVERPPVSTTEASRPSAFSFTSLATETK